MPKEIKCPRCGTQTVYDTKNPYRPFCSERCKLIDLGQWAMGKYAIPTEEVVSDPQSQTASDEQDEKD